jgi:hypothetical protein
MLPLLTPALPERVDLRSGAGGSLVQLLQRVRRAEKERRAGPERRASSRVPVMLSVEARAPTGTATLDTFDVSTFGLSTREGPTFATGATVALRLFLPDEPSAALALTAQVVGPFSPEGGMRLRFVNPPLEAVRRIHRLVQR